MLLLTLRTLESTLTLDAIWMLEKDLSLASGVQFHSESSNPH